MLLHFLRFNFKIYFPDLNQDDTQAGRTIFVGNLPGDVRDTELRRLFEAFGPVDEVDIKLLADSNAAYAFILFQVQINLFFYFNWIYFAIL